MSSLIPESAPFTGEQRAWLNGFFAGMMGIEPGVDQREAFAAAGFSAETLGGPTPAVEEEEDFPWHDSALPIVDRMDMAEGKPIEKRLMAAMAQLDCGSCGYICQTYSEAIASGEETNLSLCSPGGKETKQMIKKLVKESGVDATKTSSNGTSTSETSSQYGRSNPFAAKLVESLPLNKEGSAKDTRHVEIDLSGSGLRYDVGDALGVLPTNCDELSMAIVNQIHSEPNFQVLSPLGQKKGLLDVLREDCCLRDPSDELLELILGRVDDLSAKTTLQSMLDEGVPDGFDVLDVLETSSGVNIAATEFVETLEPLNPRLYSIASSMKAVGDSVHLTVGKVVYEREGRVRKGVASTMLAERVEKGMPIRVFVQPNHGGFTVPEDPNTPMIMVGPGTGIAPFIAFLQEREATKAPGNNWLFFGDQHESVDFLYEERLKSYFASGLLNRLDTAFSRDGEEKVYVQDRMREQGAALFQWLSEGAHFYVCGDASRMAADVDRALKEVVAEHGGMSDDEAAAYVSELSKTNRYVRDVY